MYKITVTRHMAELIDRFSTMLSDKNALDDRFQYYDGFATKYENGQKQITLHLTKDEARRFAYSVFRMESVINRSQEYYIGKRAQTYTGLVNQTWKMLGL